MLQCWQFHNLKKEKITDVFLEDSSGVSLETFELGPEGDALSFLCKDPLVVAPAYFFHWCCLKFVNSHYFIVLSLGMERILDRVMTEVILVALVGTSGLLAIVTFLHLDYGFCFLPDHWEGLSRLERLGSPLLEWWAGLGRVSWIQTLPCGRKLWSWRQRDLPAVPDGRRESSRGKSVVTGPWSRGDRGCRGSWGAAWAARVLGTCREIERTLLWGPWSRLNSSSGFAIDFTREKGRCNLGR